MSLSSRCFQRFGGGAVLRGWPHADGRAVAAVPASAPAWGRLCVGTLRGCPHPVAGRSRRASMPFGSLGIGFAPPSWLRLPLTPSPGAWATPRSSHGGALRCGAVRLRGSVEAQRREPWDRRGEKRDVFGAVGFKSLNGVGCGGEACPRPHGLGLGHARGACCSMDGPTARHAAWMAAFPSEAHLALCPRRA